MLDSLEVASLSLMFFDREYTGSSLPPKALLRNPLRVHSWTSGHDQGVASLFHANTTGWRRVSLSTRPFYKKTRSASCIDANFVNFVLWAIAQSPQFQESCRIFLCRGISENPQECCSWILCLLSRTSPATDQVESPVFVVTEDINILFSSSVNNLQNLNSQDTLRWETPSVES